MMDVKMHFAICFKLFSMAKDLVATRCDLDVQPICFLLFF
jgi:hypothetical protein